MGFYDLEINTPSGQLLKMNDLQGKVVLVVNTATKCGLTPQFEGLEKLHQDYKDKGLVVIGFPCNQFKSQEPETNESMVSTCQINHGVTFQLTEKIDVNGDNAHPIYKYLKKELGSLLGSQIKWNFEKFLISKTGEIVDRVLPTVKPESMEEMILQELNK